MVRLQTLAVAALFLYHSAGDASSGVSLGSGAFQGNIFGGITYEWRHSHSLGLAIGQYRIGSHHGSQANLVYTFTPSRVRLGEFSWAPLQPGLALLYAFDNDAYFFFSPSQYPEPFYYEITNLRSSFMLSTTLEVWDERLRLSYDVLLLDSGVIAAINNRPKDVTYFLSSGVRLQFFF